MPAFEATAAGMREGLAEFGGEEIDTLTGEVMVSRASEKVLDPVHHQAVTSTRFFAVGGTSTLLAEEQQ